jgi:HEPN domain-containing protein
MKTIQTKPDTTLMFGEIPDGVSIDKITEMVGVFGQVIGKLSEITEEQARELVNQTGEDQYRRYWYSHPLQNIFTNIAVESLESAALSVGIKEEDFDKYLVIKL